MTRRVNQTDEVRGSPDRHPTRNRPGGGEEVHHVMHSPQMRFVLWAWTERQRAIERYLLKVCGQNLDRSGMQFSNSKWTDQKQSHMKFHVGLTEDISVQ